LKDLRFLLAIYNNTREQEEPPTMKLFLRAIAYKLNKQGVDNRGTNNIYIQL